MILESPTPRSNGVTGSSIAAVRQMSGFASNISRYAGSDFMRCWCSCTSRFRVHAPARSVLVPSACLVSTSNSHLPAFNWYDSGQNRKYEFSMRSMLERLTLPWNVETTSL